VSARYLSDNIWSEITKAAKARRGPSFVAVPYFGQAGSRLLPLKKGDRLVVNASMAAVTSGQTYPKGLRSLLNRGVKLYTFASLHAKVYVFGATAFVGSANASSNSKHGLEEAVVRVRDSKLADEARRHIQSLCDTPLVHKDLDRLEKNYQPPRRASDGPTSHTPRRSAKTRHFVAQINEDEIGEECEEALKNGDREAKSKRERRNTFLDRFWRKGKVPYRTGDMVIMVFKTRRQTLWIYPPGKIIYRQVVPHPRTSTTIVHLEIPDRPRRRLDTVSSRLARRHRGRIKKNTLVGDSEFRARLLELLG